MGSIDSNTSFGTPNRWEQWKQDVVTTAGQTLRIALRFDNALGDAGPITAGTCIFIDEASIMKTK